MAINNLQHLSIGPAVPVGPGEDVAATELTDFTTEQRFQSATQYNWVQVDMRVANVWVSIAKTASAAPTADDFHEMVREDQVRYFRLPPNCLPDVKIISTAGAASGAVFFHM